MTKKKGFTLVELLVVIAILAILATVSIVGYTSFIQKANDSNALTELKQTSDVVYADLIGVVGKQQSEAKIVVNYNEGNNTANKAVEFSYDESTGLTVFKSVSATASVKTESAFAVGKEFDDGILVSGEVYYSGKSTLTKASTIGDTATKVYYVATIAGTGSKTENEIYYSDKDCTIEYTDNFVAANTYYYFAETQLDANTKLKNGRVYTDEKVYYSDSNLTSQLSGKLTTATYGYYAESNLKTFDLAFKDVFEDVDLEGTFDASNVSSTGGYIQYTTVNGKGNAYWTSGKQPSNSAQ